MKLIEEVKTILDAAEVVYSTPADDIITARFDQANLVISTNDEKSVVELTAWCRVRLQDEKMAAGYKLMNELNSKYNQKFYIDSDGDLKLEFAIDTDGGHFGREILMAGIGRLVNAAETGYEEMMKLRYGD